MITRGFGKNQRIITRGLGKWGTIVAEAKRRYVRLTSKIAKVVEFTSWIK